MEKKYRRMKRASTLLAVLLVACVVVIGCLAVKIEKQESAYEELSEEYGELEDSEASEEVEEIEESTDDDSVGSSGHASWVLSSWKTSLKQLGLDVDAVFFGDSITMGGDYQSYFDEASVVNLGVSGDTLEEMLSRTSMISSVSPEKIFIMGGINSLGYEDPETALEEYETLLDQIISENPDAEIYVESLLPVGEDNTVNSVDNSEVIEFNEGLQELAESRGLVYIDLYSLYVDEDGFLDANMTDDGLHPTSDSYTPWYEAVEEYVYEGLS